MTDNHKQSACLYLTVHLCRKRRFLCDNFVFFCVCAYACSDSTADILVRQGPFSVDDPRDYSVDVSISDGGRPLQTSITKLAIKVLCVFLCITYHT